MKKYIFSFLLLVLAVHPDLFGKGDAETAEDFLRNNVVERKLGNGITLLMLNRGFAPTLAMEISFRVGSSDESYRTIGAAHMLEHMLFKGTDRLGTKDFEKEKVLLKKIEALGETLDRLKQKNPSNVLIPELEEGLKKLQKEHSQYVVSSPYDKIYTANGGVGFNASTSRDKTGYYIELPSSKLELWAQLESERLRNPVLREYYLERNNVLQERLMRTDSVGTGLLNEQFIAAAFEAHPYRHPIIGWKSSIENLSIKDIRRFYNTYYIPSRMVITIVGKQDVEATYSIISKYFEGLASKPEPPYPAIQEPLQRGEKRFSLMFESNPYIMIGWHKPTFPDNDDYVCDVIAEILAGGRSSALYRRLVIEKKMVSSISAWNGYPAARYDNLFVIAAAPANGYSLEDVEKEIYSVIDETLKKVTQEDLDKVVVGIESELVFSLDTNKGLGHMISYYQTIFEKWQYIITYLKSVKGVSIQDVHNAAEAYFVPENRIVGFLKDSRKKSIESNNK